VRKPFLAFLAAIPVVVAGCSQNAPISKSSAPTAGAQATAPTAGISVPGSSRPDSGDDIYTPPTAEEAAPMRPEYMAELAKIHEPPEMAGKPMQVRKAASPLMVRLGNVLNDIGSPEKATHQQRATTIRELLEIVRGAEQDDGVDKGMTSGAVAALACVDEVDPKTIIGYIGNADVSGDILALRARMYLRAGDRSKALDDLEKVMADHDGHALVGGDTDPRKDSAPCGWSIADFDAFGSDPRAIAAKALYLSAFIGYNAEARGTVKEATIRDLYARSAKAWHSPIPHYLVVYVDGLGSEHSMAGAGCIRANGLGGLMATPDVVCKISRLGTRRFPELGTPMTGPLAEPSAMSFTRPFSWRQVFAL
jgi:hypothetical protein